MITKTWGSTATNLRRPTDGHWDADEARLTQTHEVTPVDLGVPTIAAISTDPGYTGGGLWGMYGDTTTVANPYGSQAGEAWANGFTGSTSTIVGVIDTGIDYTHPDLFANVWLNQREIPYTLRVSLSDIDTDGLITLRDLNDAANADWVRDGNANGFIDARDLLTDSRWENGVDDNADGFVDDLIGWDFVNNDNDPYDDNGHGTHVSGTIGAMGSNGIGVAGVNWSIQIVPLKFLSSSGSGTLSNAIRAVDYVTNLAAHASAGENYVATNNSWGGGGYVQQLSDAIVRAARQDVLFIAAAGNSASNNDTTASYPANYSTTAAVGYESVISVASLTSSGGLSSFSNYGQTTVDLAAPGSSIYSTMPGGGYGTLSGTSMATPHVTGAVALYASTHQSATAAEIRAALLASVAPTASLAGKVATGGRLDIGQLMSTAPGTPAPEPPPPPVPTDLIAGDTTTTENLAAGATRASAVDFAGDQDWYRVDLTAGNTYQINLAASAGSPLDAYLRVLDSSGNEIGHNDDALGTNSRLSVQVLTSGTYFVSAQGYQSSAGAYSLSLSNGTPAPTDAIAGDVTTTESLAAGATRASAVDFAGDQDWYRVDLTAGNTYQINLAASAGSTLDAYLRVLDAAGNEIGHNDDAVGTNARLSVQVLTSGTYFVSAQGYQSSAGAYSLLLSNGSPVSTLNIAAVNPAGVLEGNTRSTTIRFQVTRTGNTTQEATATWTVSGFGSTSADNQDFAAKAMQSGTVRFRAGETSRFVDVAVAGDTTFEADETFAVTLSNASWGSMIGTGQAVGTILNDESVVSIAAADAVRAEGNKGSTAFTFTLTRTGSTEGSSRVDWTVSGSGAAAATARDFSGNRLPSGSVTFRKGETERTIIVQAATDRTAEADEGFTVTLVRPTTGTSLGVASANGTILNDDGTVLSSAIGARSALAPTAMTFLAPAEAVTASGLPLAAPASVWLPPILVDPRTVELDLKGQLPELCATVEGATNPIQGGMSDDGHQGVVLVLTRPDTLG